MVNKGEMIIKYPNQDGNSEGTEFKAGDDVRKVPVQIIDSPRNQLSFKMKRTYRSNLDDDLVSKVPLQSSLHCAFYHASPSSMQLFVYRR